jgi:DNA-binding NarL/FixJ family response regulator
MTSKPERTPLTVALVEDDREIREMLTRAVCKTSHFDFVGSFSNGETALAELPALKPRVVIMDIQLPGMDGVECTQRLKQIMPATQVLVFTAFMDSDLIFKALAAGASGYLLKRTARSEIVNAIEEVCHGGAPMSGVIARKVVESFRTPPPVSPSPAADAQLTAREEQVLKLLAAGHGNKAIAAALFVSNETVRFHLKHIYEKLHVRSRTEAVIKYLK